MPSLAYLHDPRHAADDASARLLPPAFADLGWQVDCLDTATLAAVDGQVMADSSTGGTPTTIHHDLVWIGGFGPQGSFLDRMQLLAGLPGQQFCNHPCSLVMLHGKLAMGWLPDTVPQPPVTADSRVDRLLAKVATGGRWVAKPPAGSQGRDVFVLEAGDSNCRAILEHLTGHGTRMALLQPWVAAAAEGELRVLLAAGETVGCYHRRGLDHRNNLHRGGTASAADLAPQQQAVVAALGAALLERGVAWVGIDLAGDTVLEVNLACPGGLGTLLELGDAAAPRAAAAINRWFAASGAGRSGLPRAHQSTAPGP